MYRHGFLIGLMMLLLFPLHLHAQEEKRDSVASDKKNILTSVTDGVVNLTDDVATAVRHTGRKIRKVGKEFNAIDTTYIRNDFQGSII